MHNTIRQPAVAGMFYPNNQNDLSNTVKQFLQQVNKAAGPVPKAIIAPHAGYIYSGAIAASVYARVAQGHDIINKVVLLGPSHRVPLKGLAASAMSYFATPLSKIPVDQQAIEAILSLPQVSILEAAHATEHSLEVQLPFLQEVLGDFSVIPLVVGEASPEEVGEVLDRLWGGPETLIVISSDLSHYYRYEAAQKLDKQTSEAIEALRLEDIAHEQACGYHPVKGLLHVAKARGLQAQTVDLRNSGDTAGTKDQVVGYGAYVFN